MRILNFNGFLLEKKNFIKKIKKFTKLSQIYNWAHETDKGQSIWLSNVMVKSLIALYNNSDKIKDYLKSGECDDDDFINSVNVQIERYKLLLHDKITRVLHYVNSPLHDNKPNINNLSLKDAIEVSDKWHDEIETKGKRIKDEDGYILMTFPDDYYWIDLQTTKCDKEAESMGHCGTVNKATTLLSLRKNQTPHVTIGYDENDNIFTQIKGKGNKKPIEKYHEYIVDLIIDLDVEGFKSEYDRTSDLLPEDLSKDLFNKLEEKAPKYIENSKERPIEELRDMYRNDIYNNMYDFAYNWQNQFLDFISNDYVEDVIEEMSQQDLEYVLDEEEILDNVNNYIGEADLKNALINSLDKDDDDYEENVESIEDDPYQYNEENYDNSLNVDLLNPYNYQILTDYFTVMYDGYTAAELIDEIHGHINRSIYQILIPYFDEDGFVNYIVDNEDEDYLRERYN